MSLFLNDKVLGQVQPLHMCVCDLHLSVSADWLTLRHLAWPLLVKDLHMSQSSLLKFLGQIDLIRDTQTVPDLAEL